MILFDIKQAQKEEERKQRFYKRLSELKQPLYRFFNAYNSEYEKLPCPIEYVYLKILEHAKGENNNLPENVHIIKTKAEAIKIANITGNMLVEVVITDHKGIPITEYTKNKYWIGLPWRDAKVYKSNRRYEAGLAATTVEYSILHPYWQNDQLIKRIIVPKGYEFSA